MRMFVIEPFGSLERCNLVELSRAFRIDLLERQLLPEELTSMLNEYFQAELSIFSIQMAVLHAFKNDEGTRGLEKIKTVLTSYGVDVNHELCCVWQESFLSLIEKYDPHFNEDVHVAWIRVFAQAKLYLTSRAYTLGMNHTISGVIHV